MHNRHFLLNLAGFGLPMLAGLIAIPQLLNLISLNQFALLSMGWLLVGFVGVLDLGVARAITYSVAHHHQHLTVDELKAMVGKLTKLSILIGIAWLGFFWLLMPYLLRHLLNVPAEMQAPAVSAFQWLLLSIPFLLYTNARLALLEGQQRFTRSNLHKIPFGMLLFLLPWWIALISPNLESIFVGLLILRVVYAFSFSVGMWSAFYPGLSLPSGAWKQALSFGKWASVSHILMPVMTYFDRFYISALLSLGSVTFYSVPYDVITRLLVLPTALMTGFFPAFTSSYRNKDRDAMQTALRHAQQLFLKAWLPLMLIVFLLVKPMLFFWLPESLAKEMVMVAQILAVGVFVSGMASVSYNMLHAMGMAKQVVKLQLIQLPVYLLAFYGLVLTWGIVGAAMVWLGRSVLDFLMLYWLVYRELGMVRDVLANVLKTFLIGLLLFTLLYVLGRGFLW